jgi:hypothetical protein
MQNPNDIIKQPTEHLQEAQDRLFFLAESAWMCPGGSRDADRLIMTRGASLVISDCKTVLEKVQRSLDELQQLHDWQ